MSETGNIEDLAKEISKDIFKWFKWKRCKLTDVNVACISEHHKKKTHPVDVVYYYDAPYSGSTIYLNTDLKSYKKGTIQPSKISSALKSLSMSVECANISEDWQDKFIVDSTTSGKVLGLLFIYNHDNEFDKSLSDLVSTMDLSKIEINENVEIVLFDPDRIRNLLNIVNDLKDLIADDTLPRVDYTFFYPDLVMTRRHGEEWDQPASIDALTSPWLMIKHRSTAQIAEGYLIYYQMSGKTVEEFIYLVDAMSRYQMLLSDKPIRVRFTNPDETAPNNFNKAILEYSRLWGDDPGRKKQLDRIDARRITKVVPNYCPYEIGMRDHVE